MDRLSIFTENSKDCSSLIIRITYNIEGISEECRKKLIENANIIRDKENKKAN